MDDMTPHSTTHMPSPAMHPITTSNNLVATQNQVKMSARNVDFYYGTFKALHDVSLDFHSNRVTALIGPSGCGKSTFLRNLNRINETLRNTRMDGTIQLDGENIRDMDVTSLRRRVGMVFQRPNPFPKSIFDNIAYGPRINGM